MINTLATLALGAMMMAFAIFAVMLNEGERSRLRKNKRLGEGLPNGDAEEWQRQAAAPIPGWLPDEEPVLETRPGQRRLPVGEFLFGALFLRGSEPLAFSELAQTAGECGMDISQVLAWVARAEEGGLLERVTDLSADGWPSAHPAVRLTSAGMDLARNNRRQGRRSVSSLHAGHALDNVG